MLHRGRLSKDMCALQMTEGLISLTCSPEQLCLLDFSSDERSDCFGETWHVFPERKSAESAALRRWFTHPLQLFVMHQRSSFRSTLGILIDPHTGDTQSRSSKSPRQAYDSCPMSRAAPTRVRRAPSANVSEVEPDRIIGPRDNDNVDQPAVHGGVSVPGKGSED